MATTESMTNAESARLEALWGGEFGDAYVDRNREAVNQRGPFWERICERCQPTRVLEIGCNIGGNLKPLADRLPSRQLFGVDVNEKALCELQAALPGVNTIWTAARDLPLRDRWFDLVFTMGVLIHQPEATLPLVMSEVVRCSSRYVLCGEYFAEQTTEVAYRGQEGALFKRDYGRLYGELFPELRLLDKGFLGRDEGWDDVTWWLFERP